MVRLALLALGMLLLATAMRQCRKPRGPVGRRAARAMNLTHSRLTEWGLQSVAVGTTFAILDVGCGGGETIRKLSAAASEGRVSGVDYSPDCVAVARETNAAAIAEGRVDVREASVSQLPFADATFDLVTAVETHYYWPDLASDLAGIRRVLKPGGRLVVIAEAYAVGWRGPFYRVVMGLLGGRILSANGHRAALASAGYSEIEVREDRLRGWIAVSGRRPAPGAPGKE